MMLAVALCEWCSWAIQYDLPEDGVRCALDHVRSAHPGAGDFLQPESVVVFVTLQTTGQR